MRKTELCPGQAYAQPCLLLAVVAAQDAHLVCSCEEHDEGAALRPGQLANALQQGRREVEGNVEALASGHLRSTLGRGEGKHIRGAFQLIAPEVNLVMAQNSGVRHNLPYVWEACTVHAACACSVCQILTAIHRMSYHITAMGDHYDIASLKCLRGTCHSCTRG